MQKRQTGQLGIEDGLLPGRPSFLTEVDALVDWAPVEAELSGIHAAVKGRPSYPLLMMFKVLLLQRWYNLSDPAMEEALADRVSFRRFVGLGLADEVPDHSTICRFRGKLEGRVAKLLAALNAQFEARGLVIKKGTLLDASFIKSASGKRERDPEAGPYGRHKEGNVSGYKAHVGVDQDSGLVRKVVVTKANVNDTEVADDLVLGDEKAVYADKAYDTKKRRRDLEAKGVHAGLMHRPSGPRKLTQAQIDFNKAVTKVRAPVERAFAVLKQHYRLRRARYLGLGRVNTEIHLAIMAMNLKRALVLA